MNGWKWPGRRNVVPETPASVAERLERLHGDPVMRHTSETPTAAQEPAGEATVDAEAQAEREAAMEALRARVAALKATPVVKRSRPAVARPVDLDAMVDARVQQAIARMEQDRLDRERREAQAKAQAEREEEERLARGGPCKYCGLTMSWERGEHGEPVGVWYADDTCTWCNTDRKRFARSSSDADHRALVLCRYVLPKEVTKYWGDKYLLEKCKDFRWWSESPGAATTEDSNERFGYVDREPLLKALEPPKIEYATREPCPRCGCPSRWLWSVGYSGETQSSAVRYEQWACAGCRNAGDLNEVISRVTGLRLPVIGSLGVAADKVLGVSWWSDSGAEPCAQPFAYVNWDGVRHRAFELFPAEHKWSGWATWQRAKALAES